MCITNDDAIRNGNKRNNVMEKEKRKKLEEIRKTRKKKGKSCNNRGKQRNKR